ncbi:MAG: hypothetical protein R6V02_00570 [Candidatus Aminicenantes bacterium]
MNKKRRTIFQTAAAIVSCLILAAPELLKASSEEDAFNSGLLSAFQYRELGPARQGGRILRVLSHPEEEFTFFVVTATGGLWKTGNNGTTFECLFENEGSPAIGDAAVSLSNPEILWVGTGSPASGRISLLGDGVYKSNDGGQTWRHMGLTETRHIGRIQIHPENPDVLYAAAVGYHFSFNPERGLYKTIDGGESWEKVLFISEKTGVVDVVLDPEDPDTVYAVAYDKERVPWNFDETGPESGIYKSSDAGQTWDRLTNGLPSGEIGRIGVTIYPQNTDILYASVENGNMRPPTEEEAERDRRRGREPEERKIGRQVYRSNDGGLTWQRTHPEEVSFSGGKWYGVIYVDPNDPDVVYLPSVPLLRSTDGGKTWGEKGPENIAPAIHVDHHALWIDPDDSSHIRLGNDGGLAVSYDFGETWDFYENLPIAQFYAVGVDMEQPYNIYGGLQDNGSVKFPSNSIYGEITRDDMEWVGGGDGMYNLPDPENSRWLYNESQFGWAVRTDQLCGTRTTIRPSPDEEGKEYRFHWTTPMAISPHNTRILYIGSQYLMRSFDQGDTWQEISPDLSGNDPKKLEGNIEFCLLSSISESPLQAGVIWAGTDDGKVHVTRNHGGTWTDVTSNLSRAGAPEAFYVSRVFASHHEAGRAYAVKTGFQRDDFRPFVFRTDDFGKTWTDISGDLPEGIIYVIAEDHKNPGLLFVGRDFDVRVTIDGGKKWVPMKNNMPTNSVHDLLIHPRENDLVVGTHGRGVWVTDIIPLQEMDQDLLSKDVHLFNVEDKIRWEYVYRGNIYGHRQFTAVNEPVGLVINYYLGNEAAGDVKITISGPYGEVVRELEGPGESGINRVIWDMRKEQEETEEEETARRPRRGEWAETGEYVITLETGGQTQTRRAHVLPMPELHLLNYFQKK